MKRDTTKTLGTLLAIVMMLGLLVPGTAVATHGEDPGDHLPGTGDCVTIYTNPPDVVVDPESCKDLITGLPP